MPVLLIKVNRISINTFNRVSTYYVKYRLVFKGRESFLLKLCNVMSICDEKNDCMHLGLGDASDFSVTVVAATSCSRRYHRAHGESTYFAIRTSKRITITMIMMITIINNGDAGRDTTTTLRCRVRRAVAGTQDSPTERARGSGSR